MHINVTVIIQIINFIIAHAILSRFLLKPFAQRILQKQRARKAMIAGFKDKEAQLQSLAVEKNRLLLVFQAHVQKNYKTPKINLVVLPSLVDPVVDATAIEAMTKATTKIIIKKASHA